MKGNAMQNAEHIYTANQAALDREALSLWTIYNHPADFPHSYVARRFETANGRSVVTEDIVQCNDLSTLRKSFEMCGMARLPRDVSDEPSIIETWL